MENADDYRNYATLKEHYIENVTLSTIMVGLK